MELGISMFGDNHYDKDGKPLPPSQRLQELIEEIKLMDEVGLDFFENNFFHAVVGVFHRPHKAK